MMTRDSRIRRRRGGYTVVEVTICVLIMGAILAIVAQSVRLLGKQQQMTQRRTLAVQELSNAMERAAALPFDRVSDDALKQITLSKQANEKLREPALNIDVEVGDDGGSKRVTMTLDWQNAAGQRVQPLRLVAWRYQTAEAIE